MAAVLPDATKLAEFLFKDYGIQNTAVLIGIFRIMYKNRSDFVLFRQRIEDRLESLEEDNEGRDKTLTEHWNLINSHGRKLAAQGATLKSYEKNQKNEAP